MSSPQFKAEPFPNLWHLSALAWGASILLLSLFAMPISYNPTGMRLQLGLSLAHFAGVACLWRLAATRGNPERLLEAAIVTLIFIYVVPFCMLIAPVIVLAAYALPTTAWQTAVPIILACMIILALQRLWVTATDKNTGRHFEQLLAGELKGNAIASSSIITLLTHVGSHPTQPTRIDGWSMLAAIAAGAPIFTSTIAYDSSSGSLALCVLITTPMAMHAFSRMVVHAYLWLYRLHRYERATGSTIVVKLVKRN